MAQGATYKVAMTRSQWAAIFGYIGDNPKVASNLHGLNDFDRCREQQLPSSGGVHVRGGYGNLDDLQPLDPTYGGSELRGATTTIRVILMPTSSKAARR